MGFIGEREGSVSLISVSIPLKNILVIEGKGDFLLLPPRLKANNAWSVVGCLPAKDKDPIPGQAGGGSENG